MTVAVTKSQSYITSHSHSHTHHLFCNRIWLGDYAGPDVGPSSGQCTRTRKYTETVCTVAKGWIAPLCTLTIHYTRMYIYNVFLMYKGELRR
jgi:hypothetical protein